MNLIAFCVVYILYLQYMIKIDTFNKKILHILQKDARITNVELAQRVGLSPSACLRRVQELERQEVITGYTVKIDKTKLGIGLVLYAAVTLSNHSKASIEEAQRIIQAAPEITECHLVTGSIEFLMRIEVADLEAFKLFHHEILSTIPNVSNFTSYVCVDSPKDARA